jgi:hypothetical protein
VDEIMGFEDAKAKISTTLGNGDIIYYIPKQNTIQFYFGQLFGLADLFDKKSDLQVAKEMIENDESGVLMYYAK